MTVMEVFEGTLENRSSVRESLLGGEDSTARIVSKILESADDSRPELAELNDPLRVEAWDDFSLAVATFTASDGTDAV